MGAETHANEIVWTVGRLLQWTTEHFRRAGIEDARLAAELLLSHALGCSKIELYTRFDAVPEAEPRSRFRDLVRRATEPFPVAYLVGHREFYSLDFEVSPAVLIPRPETELLVDRVVEHCRRLGREQPLRLIDVGTGSGCISIAVLTHVPNASALATDISAEALDIARRNRERHGLADRLALEIADGLNLPASVLESGRFDVLVSNPPYVSDAEMERLPKVVRDCEPRIALTAGPDGLEIYRLFASGAHAVLAPGGSVFVEIGYDQRDAVIELFCGDGRYVHGGTWRDAGDPHDRVVQFILEKG